MSTIACDIVTGFLGSGKTTFLKHVLQHGLQGKRVAIVMNELGDVGIDGTVLTGFSAVEKMVEVNSGCICCSVTLQFTVAIHEIVQAVHPQLILLETTGVADPEPLILQAKQAGLALDAVIAVVDAADVLALDKKARVVRRQAEMADFVVINKTDLVDAKQLAKVRKWVEKRNRRALVFETTRGAVPSDLLFGTSVGRLRAEAAANGSAEGHDHLAEDGISAFVFESAHRLERRKFEKMLRGLPDDVYRAKGVIRFTDLGVPQIFNFTCGRYDFDLFPLDASEARTQAVFIGRDIEAHRPRIEKDLSRCEARE
jgi:G3E family GTPase